MRSFVLAIAFCVALLNSARAVATEDKFPSPTGGAPTPLLFLHALVNYTEDPRWMRSWERQLQSTNSLRVNVGSVGADDFMTDIELHLTVPIHERFRALYDMHWWEATHVNAPGQEHFLGFEFAVLPTAGLQMQVNPVAQKEDLDLRAGLLVHTEDREQYARLLLRWDDVLFTRKNDRGGRSDAIATRFGWVARGRHGRFEAFSRGSYGSEGRHSFPDSAQSPIVAADVEQRGDSDTRLRCVWSDARFVELVLLHHRLRLSCTPQTGAGAVPDTYDNAVFDVAARMYWVLDRRWSVRGELHRVHQEAQQTGSAPYDYTRTDWMPAAFVQWRFLPSHQLELGWLGADYEWQGSPDVGAVDESGFVQKLKLAWLFAFSPNARMQISLSHEPDPQRFGGGNIHVQVEF